ncbi:hypothetical protein QBC40DRAFT_348807 [Triangularia verruculosa]|uniref:Uncharacterized protein n=1 Tax=Triangularia verruculosa TaxID=2587418 RepID=A0AAN7AVI6_9PEZI|nr:hypothetical protein QBC40DRAFT_348807 [Triangularia verruculosa]
MDAYHAPELPQERRSKLKSITDRLLGRKPKSFKVIRSRMLNSVKAPLPEIMEDASHDAALPDPSFTTIASSSTNPSENGYIDQGCRSLICFVSNARESASISSSSDNVGLERVPAFCATGPSRSCAALEETLVPIAVQPQTFFLRGVPRGAVVRRPRIIITTPTPSVTSASSDDASTSDASMVSDGVNEIPDDRLTLPSQRRR